MRSSLVKSSVGVLFILALAAPAYASASPGELFVDPNPCISVGLCTAHVSWQSADSQPDSQPQPSNVQIWVSKDSQPAKLFVCKQRTFTADVPWIQTGHSYEFTAYAAGSCKVADRQNIILSRVSVAGIPSTPTASVTRSVGANTPFLSSQYLGLASGGNGSDQYRAVDAAMAKKAILDAKSAGSSFVRVAITGYSADHLGLWRSNPTRYWMLIDQMFSDLRASDMKIVPVFVWNSFQFPTMANGTLKDMLANPKSSSYLLLTQYIRDFISRYKNDPTILFYELTNELNLRADLDIKTRCVQQGVANNCAVYENFSTMDMIGFTSSLAAYIRTLDATRFISSGFSIPRPSAEHLRVQPEWSADGPDWTLDSQEQFTRNITDTNQGVDIVSMHFYKPNNLRWGDTGTTLSTIKNAVDSLGKKLYLGEFGSGEEPVLLKDVLNSILTLNIPYASPWVWEFYQFSTHVTGKSPAEAGSIEPGYTDDVIDAIRQTNVHMGNTPTTSSVPRVIITWPLNTASISSSQLIYAVASSGQGKKVARVDFILDGAVKASVVAPPYQYTLSRTLVKSGIHQLVARAYDEAGVSADSVIQIQNGVVNNFKTSL